MSDNKKPTHRAYVVIPTEDKKGIWQPIGSVWPHNDGDGFNIKLNSTPVNGSFVIRKIGDKPELEESAIPTQ